MPSTMIAGIENLTLNIAREVHVNAPLETTFEALLEQIGPGNESENGPMPMKLEAWPGGRWYRDLSENNGHFWGTVQAIKRRPCSKSADRCSCRIRRSRMCNTG